MSAAPHRPTRTDGAPPERDGSPGDAMAAALLRGARPRAADEDRIIAIAMLAGAARHRRHERGRVIAWVGGLAAAAACLAVALSWPDDALSRFELSRGDVLTGVGGARFRALAGEERDRVVALDEGAMLFEVQPLADDESFEVRTSDCVVRVRGTIFAVGTGASGTRVEVFEGHVEVDRGGAHAESLRAGDSSGPAVAQVDRLREAGATAARERTALLAAAAQASAVVAVVAEHEPEPSSAGLAQESPLSPPAREAIDEPALHAAIEPTPAASPAPSGRRVTRDMSAGELRQMIARGEADRALAAAEAQLAQRDDAELRFVAGDALRQLHRYEEAADTYERAAGQLEGTRRVQAGYLAALLRLETLHDSERALTTLDRSGASDEGSPLRERALLLRARALRAAGRDAEVARIGVIYLALYPTGSGAAFFAAPPE